MAGIDYVSCVECGKRLLYDGKWEFRNGIHMMGNTKNITCDHCVKKFKQKIIELQKHDRRKH